MKNISKIVSTWFGIGLIKFAPGTFGSIASAPFAYLVFKSGFLVGLWLIIILCLVSFFSISQYLTQSQSKDPKEVVIDEVIGQTLTVWILSTFVDSILRHYHIGFVQIFFISLFFFRLFDILKIWPINFIDKNIGGAIGVILDDVLAAFFASFCCIIFVLIEVLIW